MIVMMALICSTRAGKFRVTVRGQGSLMHDSSFRYGIMATSFEQVGQEKKLDSHKISNDMSPQSVRTCSIASGRSPQQLFDTGFGGHRGNRNAL